MNKIYLKWLCSIFVIFALLNSCEKALMEGEPNYSPQKNFEYLWEQADKKYSYFDVKNVNWDEVYTNYAARVNNDMSDEAFFNLMFDMLSTLKDGHVNLKSPFNVSRYDISHNAQQNFNWQLIKNYYLDPGEKNHFNITEHHYITGNLRHQIFPVGNKKIGYMYYSSFSQNISNYDIDYTLNRMQNTNGLIIDMRNNGGGALKNIFQIAERLTTTKRYIYASRTKDGAAHNDFGELLKVYAEPQGQVKYTKPVALLTNRNCYSATTFFAAAMKAYPHVTQIGDTTGGGAGIPHGGQMPNGWYYRFSVSRTGYPTADSLYDFETGVPPEIYVNLNEQDEMDGHDTMIDTAVNILLSE